MINKKTTTYHAVILILRSISGDECGIFIVLLGHNPLGYNASGKCILPALGVVKAGRGQNWTEEGRIGPSYGVGDNGGFHYWILNPCVGLAK